MTASSSAAHATTTAARTREPCSILARDPGTGFPLGDDAHLFEVVGVHGRLDYYLLVLVYVLRAYRLDGPDEEAWGEQKLPVTRPAAGDHVVALLGARAQIYVLDPEVPLQVRPEEPLAVGDVRGGDRGAELARGRVELGRRDYPDPRAELPVGDEHDLGRATADIVGGAPDKGVVPDQGGHPGP